MSQCSGCGTEFECGVEAQGEGAPCWCMRLPSLPLSSEAKTKGKADAPGCFCPICLQRRIEEFQKLRK